MLLRCLLSLRISFLISLSFVLCCLFSPCGCRWRDGQCGTGGAEEGTRGVFLETCHLVVQIRTDRILSSLEELDSLLEHRSRHYR